MKIDRHGSAGGRRLSRRGRCSAPPAILSTSAQADNPFSPIRSISLLALRRWVRKCGRNGRFSPQGTDNSNACLLVWSDCRCNPNTWFLVRLIHLLSQHCTREFHGGPRRASKIWICCWIYFQIRTILSGGPLILCFVVEHPHGSSHWCCSKLPQLKNPAGSNRKMTQSRNHQNIVARQRHQY